MTEVWESWEECTKYRSEFYWIFWNIWIVCRASPFWFLSPDVKQFNTCHTNNENFI